MLLDDINSGISYLEYTGSSEVSPMALDSKIVNHISAETICAYPPGVPVLLSGERISEKHVNSLLALRTALSNKGISVLPCSDPLLSSILVHEEVSTKPAGVRFINRNCREKVNGKEKNLHIFTNFFLMSHHLQGVVHNIVDIIPENNMLSIEYVMTVVHGFKGVVRKLKSIVRKFTRRESLSPLNFLLGSIIISGLFGFVNYRVKFLIDGRVTRVMNYGFVSVVTILDTFLSILFNGFR